MAALFQETAVPVEPLFADDPEPPTPLIISGTPGDDTLFGGAGDDAISAGGGNDVLDGGLGNDTLDGGEGVDTVYYQRAEWGVVVDLSVGMAISDGLDELISIENVVGSAFDDYIRGDAGANWLLGWDGDDLVVGNEGNDTLIGEQGDDTIVGGDDFDTVSFEYATTGVVVNLAAGTADGEGHDLIHDVEAVVGSHFNDKITGSAGNNWLDGGEGNDTIDGGAGFDTVSFARATTGVTVNLALGTATGYGNDVLKGIETVLGSAFDDVLIGDGGANGLLGGAGNDVLNGGGGNDTLTGGAGDDALDGGSGVDTANYSGATTGVAVDLVAGTAFGEGNDILTGIENVTGSAFDDTITGSNANNWIVGGEGNDVMNGGGGFDTVSYADAKAAVSVDLAAGTATGLGSDTLSGFETVVGSSFDDTLSGDAFGDMLNGGAGDDLLLGLAGKDTLLGGAGNDTLDGGTDFDTANFMSASTGVNADLSTGMASGDGSDVLISIEGLYGSRYGDVLTGNAGDNWLTGDAGDDVLDGGAGNDRLRGGSGADTLFGNGGNDVLEGGADADVFVMEAGTDADHITDFVGGVDHIALFGYGLSSFAELITHLEQVGGDALIHLSDTDSLKLIGVDAASLGADDFSFATMMPADFLSGAF